MKCKVCGFQNELRLGRAKFCANCGNPLSEQKKKNRYNKSSLKKKRVRNQKSSYMAASQDTFSIKKLWVGAAIILSAFLIYSIVDSDSRKLNLPGKKIVEKSSTNPVIEAKVFAIASKFACACGGCNEDPLDKCQCNFAMEERDFIRDYLKNSNTEDFIIQAVNKKYGGLKKS